MNGENLMIGSFWTMWDFSKKKKGPVRLTVRLPLVNTYLLSVLQSQCYGESSFIFQDIFTQSRKVVFKKIKENILVQILPSGKKALETSQIRKVAVNKSIWSQHFVVSKKKKPPD